MNHFCTYCDKGYAARLLCLHDSLCAQGEPFVLHVLCFDRETEAVVADAGSPNLVAVALDEVLRADPAYAAVRGERSKVEFLFTSTPIFVRFCFERIPDAAQMTYLDADLYFFGPPSAVFAVQGDASVGIVPHRFPSHLMHLESHGRYNVGWVSFRRDAEGLACLEWWRERCLEWCRDVVDGGRFADQGYLDEFPRRFRGVRALDHPGINAAPWNIDGARIIAVAGAVRIEDAPLLFFHFQGVRELLPNWYDPGLLFYSANMSQGLREFVYLPYLRALAATQERLQRNHGISPRRGYHRLAPGASWRARVDRLVVQWVLPTCRLLRGRLLHVRTARATLATP